jgi:hypothetical protein
MNSTILLEQKFFFLSIFAKKSPPLTHPPLPSWFDGLIHLDSLQRFCMEDYRAPGPAIIFIICRTMQNLCKLADRALRLPFCPIVCLSVCHSIFDVCFLGICLFTCFTVFLSVMATDLLLSVFSYTDCLFFFKLFRLSAFLNLQKLSVCLSASLYEYSSYIYL